MRATNHSPKASVAVLVLAGLSVTGVGTALAEDSGDDAGLPLGSSEFSWNGERITSFVANEDGSNNRYFPWLNDSDGSKYISGVGVADRVRGLLFG